MPHPPPKLDYSRPEPRSIWPGLWDRVERLARAAYLVVAVTAVSWLVMVIILVLFVAVRSLADAH